MERYHNIDGNNHMNLFVIQECTLHSIADRYGAIAAHHRNSEQEDTGFSFVNCSVTGTGGAVFLGRAWGNYSRAVYSYCDIDNIIDPSGWSDWNQPWRQRYPTIHFSKTF